LPAKAPPTILNLHPAQLAKLAATAPAPLRILTFVLLLGLVWLPLAALIALWSRDPNRTTILTMLLLFIGFVGLMRWWGRHLYHDVQIFQSFGLSWSQFARKEALSGFGLGVASLLLLFAVQGILGWLYWQVPAWSLIRVALEGVLVAFGVALAEELVFRGWILTELERDYRAQIALWANSLLFATLHFIKPLPEIIRTFPQFPSLVLLGLILVWMKRSTQSQRRTANSLTMRSGRLALPIGFHAGLVWGYYLIDVGDLTRLSQRAPEWVTGIDGNPLAGALGLLFLSGWAVYWYRNTRYS
jgi:uncharacterized protein